MRLETFFEKFELFAEAPGAVEKLRELVLKLAVHGKLVAQEKSDEPASALLEMAIVQRSKLTASSKPRKFQNKTVATDEQPFGLPLGWAWARLSDVGYGLGQKVPDNRFTYIDVGSIDSDKGRISDRIDILEPGDAPSRARKLVARGTVIYSTVRPYLLNIAIINKDFEPEPIASTAFGILHPFEGINSRYLFHWLRSTPFTAYVQASMKGMAYPAINDEKFYSGPIALPPTAEQKRIVAEVDELMELCDRLESQQNEREARRSKLARASLARFAESPTPASLASLFHPSYAITPVDLRKSILELAVQGKLVAQDHNDKPADELIAHIERERVQLAKEQDVRIPKNVTLLSIDDHPHEIPDSWRWSRIDHLALVIDYGTSEKAGSDSSKVPVYRMGNIVHGRLIDENLKYIDATIDDLPRLYLKTNDILFNRTNSYELVGKTSIYRGPNDKATFASYLIRIRLPSTMLFPSFFSAAMNAPYYRQTQIEPEIVQQCGQANFNGTKLAATVVPVPPLAEQRRIVAKIDGLMALVDQLEAQLAKEKSASAALLDAAIHELLNPSAEIIAFPAAQATAVDRAGIGCYVVQKLAGYKTFGRVALMKHEYLAEAHVGVNFDGHYLRQAAGPLDNWVYRFEEEAVRKDWFMTEETKTRDGHKKIIYRKGAELDVKASAAFAALPQAQRDELDRMLALLGGKPTEDVEIIATLFAVWNDFLIDGHSPSDEDIVTGFREHWHEKKQKFTAKSLHTWLDWMRRNSLVPTGRGPRTRSHPGLDLH